MRFTAQLVLTFVLAPLVIVLLTAALLGVDAWVWGALLVVGALAVGAGWLITGPRRG